MMNRPGRTDLFGSKRADAQGPEPDAQGPEPAAESPALGAPGRPIDRTSAVEKSAGRMRFSMTGPRSAALGRPELATLLAAAVGRWFARLRAGR